MIKRNLLILCLFLITIASTSCRWYGEAVGEALGKVIVEGMGEAILELIFSEIAIDAEMLFEPLRIFYENNDRWPDSKEELVEFSCEMGLDVSDEYWDSCENMRFETQADGSLNIKLKRVVTGKDGTKQCYSKEYIIDIDEYEIQIQKFNLETENGARLSMTNKNDD